jgi:hypothetical protein
MPCQLGGNPDCRNCGCMASAGLEAIGRHRYKGWIPVGPDLLRLGARGEDGRAPARRGRSGHGGARSIHALAH